MGICENLQQHYLIEFEKYRLVRRNRSDTKYVIDLASLATIDIDKTISIKAGWDEV